MQHEQGRELGFADMCVNLPQELRGRGMTVSGRKEDLALRLLDSMKVARDEAGVFNEADGRSYEEAEQEVQLAENLKPGDVEFLTVRAAAEVPPHAWPWCYPQVFWMLCVARKAPQRGSSHGMPAEPGCNYL